MKKFLRNLKQTGVALVLSVLAVPSVLSQTDIADTPMAVKNNVPPNFVFMVDSSGSMRNVVPEPPFNSEISYTTCATSGVKVDNKNSVFIRITASGVPYFSLGGTDYDWGVGTSKDTGATKRVKRCFETGRIYQASLNADSGELGGLKSPGGSAVGNYSGNYLNWYFGVAADGKSSVEAVNFGVDARLKPGQRSRMEIARQVTNATFDGLPAVSDGDASVRVGLVSYNGSNGGKLLRGVGDLTAGSLAELKGAVTALEAGGSTPLSETLADIGHYFTLGYTGDLRIHPDVEAKSQTVSVSSFFKQGTATPHKLLGVGNSTAAPVEYWCQRSYAILMTDGQPEEDQALSGNSYLCDYDGDSGSCKTTGDGAYDRKGSKAHTGHLGDVHSYVSTGSDYLDDVAQALFEIDLRPDLKAPEGRAKKNNVRTYTVGFADDAIINDPLMLETAKQGGGLFLTASDTASLQKAFKKAMDDAFAKDGASSAVAVVNTNITVDNTSYASDYSSGTWVGDLKAFSLNTTTGLPIMPEAWSAAQILDARDISADPRTIVTYDGTSSGVPFSKESSGLEQKVVDFVLGDRSEEGKVFRIRASRLGDIVNAEPVVVKYGDKTAVFQGANDGLLHVFDGALGAGGGRELWAYAPRQLHANLADYASQDYAHRYFVDGTPVVGVVTIDGDNRRILVGGYGKGGRGYYALDITTYDEPGGPSFPENIAKKVLWERLGDDSDVGFSFGRPLIVKTAMSPGWVVLVAGGHNSSSGEGVVIGLHPLTGEELLRIKTGVGDFFKPSGLAHLSRPSQLEDTETVRYVYGGDLLGNVWRFDLEANDSKGAAVRIAVLKDPAGAIQPVTTAAAVGPVVGSSDKNFVYVGTGLYLGDSDIPGTAGANVHATQAQSVYGIIDDVTVSSPALPNIRGSNGGSCPDGGGNGDFVCQDTGELEAGAYTFSSNVVGEEQTGWYFDLPVANSRVITHPQLTATGTLALTVNIPTNVKCDPGGSSWFVTVLASSGGAIPKEFGGDEYWSSMSFLGYALASRPVIITTAEGKRGVIRLSDRSFRSPFVPDPPPPPGPTPPGWRKLYWRDLGLVN